MDTAFIQDGVMKRALAATRAISQQINRSILPVDLEQIARCFGCRIEETDIKQQGYIATMNNGERLIRIRRGDSIRVKRFTLAHEIGHIILRQYVGVSATSMPAYRAQSHSYEERVADRLAAELLMPMDFFRKTLRNYPVPSQNALRAMARVFGVSLTACFRRIIEVPHCLAFTYAYDVSSRSERALKRFKGGYPRSSRLTFMDAPSALVDECLRYANTTGHLWRGYVKARIAETNLEVPAFSEVVVGSHLSTVRISGWLLTNGTGCTGRYMRSYDS